MSNNIRRIEMQFVPGQVDRVVVDVELYFPDFATYCWEQEFVIDKPLHAERAMAILQTSIQEAERRAAAAEFEEIEDSSHAG